ncbi:hypothetical protein PITC_001740 [Penicillium italicum]|uniref:Uncharacterized protein n=1 Tax=Penicillium italicum TaxID=40296 RepID=A0A0A2LFB1_PENIT|nr:hypothetical protein PITC_001740 [Penicillium italicum]
MAWPTRNNKYYSTIPESAFQWSDGESGNWRTGYPKQPETLFMSPSPDPSITTQPPTARPPPYNYQFQVPSSQFRPTPVALGSTLSPPPLSSHLDTNTIKHSINSHSPGYVPLQATNTALSPASIYDTRCPSPWDDLPVSAPIMKEKLQPDEAGQTKLPCRSRRPGAKSKCLFSFFSFKEIVMIARIY